MKQKKKDFKTENLYGYSNSKSERPGKYIIPRR